MHRGNTWHPYWDSRTKWTLLGLFKQEWLFLPKRSSCAQLKILLSNVSDKMARKPALFPQFFFNSSVNKILWKGTIPQFESPSDTIQVFLFDDSAYLLFPFIMTEFSGGGNIQDQSSSAINSLVHVSQLRINLVHWKPVWDAYSLRILIYPCSSFISSLSITQLLWVTEEKKSRTEPCVSPEKRVQPATSNLSFKGFLNEKKVTDTR